jgi:hypothetical protein
MSWWRRMQREERAHIVLMNTVGAVWVALAFTPDTPTELLTITVLVSIWVWGDALRYAWSRLFAA